MEKIAYHSETMSSDLKAGSLEKIEYNERSIEKIEYHRKFMFSDLTEGNVQVYQRGRLE